MYRIGKVSSIDKSQWQVRVRFEDEGITSGFLKVIKNLPTVTVKETKQEAKTESPNISFATYHAHDVTVEPWFPNVGELVVCIYNDEFNSDGIVIGGL